VKRLLAAGLLVLIFPIYWFSAPAIMKGWIDRVFLPALMYGGRRFYDRGPMAGRRASIVASMNSERHMFGADAPHGEMEPMFRHLTRGTLAYVGYTVLAPFWAFQVPFVADDKRRSELGRLRVHITALGELAGMSASKTASPPSRCAPQNRGRQKMSCDPVDRSEDKTSAKIWRADDLGSAELLRGRFIDYAYDVHTHDKACFSLLVRGAIRIKMRGSEFTARAGDLYAIDAEEPHAGWPIDGGGWSLRTLYVELSQLRLLLGGGQDASSKIPALAGPIIQDPQLANLFQEVHVGSEAQGPALKRDETYLSFIERLFERHTRQGGHVDEPGLKEERAIRLARDFLDHHLEDRVHLADIASAAGLPPFRLFRAFELATGMSPHTYQRQARIRFATGLIRLGHPLGDVAAASGFADQAHLTRSFRRALGVTPGAYRMAFHSR
jgi:AraC-like DNA-binding protein